MKLATILPPDAVLAGLPARDKKQALKMLSAYAAQFCNISEKDIYSTLLEREYAGCTGMGGGVCIPHGRFEGLKGLHAIFAKLDERIEFGAADGKPVDLVFLLLTPMEANNEHIKALATMSRLLRNKILCEAIRQSSDATEIRSLLLTKTEEEPA
ncbi:MAG: PTS sugar transporter subunit IIA [Rickettsiales bacterium]|nr:PTS sugar transporter subunit IIA [Rickettsiales bacterium]